MSQKALLIGAIAIICGVYYSEIESLLRTLDREIKNRWSGSAKPPKIWQLEHLRKFQHVSVFGHVFDVSSQPKFYGPEGHYSLFTGVDATRAFALSDLSGKSLISTVEGLSPPFYESAFQWLDSYKEKYPFVGYLDDLYFDSRGRPTPLYHEIRQAVQDYQKTLKDEHNRYPPCNSFSSDNENYVDCIDGFEGEWYPRLMSLPSRREPHCVCLRQNFLNSGRTLQYPGCPEFAHKCHFSLSDLDAVLAKFKGSSK